MIGQESDAFTVRIPMRFEQHHTSPRNIIHQDTSHKGLSDSIWCMHSTEFCDHDTSKPAKLEPAAFRIIAKTYGGLLDGKPSLDGSRMLIFPSAGDKWSRWYTLWWLFMNTISMDGSIMLQSRDCCTPCAIQQTSKMPGLWFLVT